jgi:hypothetical protein
MKRMSSFLKLGVAGLAFLMPSGMYNHPNRPKKSTPSIADKTKQAEWERAQTARRTFCTPKQNVINRMTNWQRNQWGRAGHPMDLEKLEHFAALPHHKRSSQQVKT